MIKDENGFDGVWRTIRGRRVFIRKGESLDSAMKRAISRKKETQRNLKMEDMEREDKQTLYEYTEGWYNPINVDLRNGKDLEASKKVANLDKAISKGYIDDGILYRTAHINELGIKMNEDNIWKKSDSNYEKNVEGLKYGSKEYYKAVYNSEIQTNKEIYNAIKDKIKVNDVIEDKAYKSTSKNENIITKYHAHYVSEEYGRMPDATQVMIKYRVIKEVNAIDIGKNSYINDQEEVLLQRNTKSKITKIEYNNKYNCTYIEMDLYK